eukprot:GEMP01031424.1.p1 GENE.GEMP01031424.1~~GEMP01031424.1.p1  ORF type:complete len:162 (+),score=31.75 GEMP01031424.1:793-1278(+)
MVVFSSFGSNKGLEHAAVEIMKVLVPWKDQGAGYHFYVTEASPGIEATNIGDHTAPYFVSESGCKLPFSNKDIHPYIRFVKGVQEVSAKAIPRYERTWWMKPIGDTLFRTWKDGQPLGEHVKLVVDRTVAAPEYSYAKPTEPPSWKIQEDRNTDPPKATVE